MSEFKFVNLNFEFKIIPHQSFSFVNWSRGYVFDRLYRISKKQFQKTISIALNGVLLHFVITLYKDTTIADLLPIHIQVQQVGPTSSELSKHQTQQMKQTIKKRIIHYLGLDDQLDLFFELLSSHVHLSSYVNILPGYQLSSVLDVEWMPLFTFLTTNTTIQNYYQFLQQFKKRWGYTAIFKDNRFNFYPKLADLLTISENEFRDIKLGYRAKYLPSLLTQLHQSSQKWLTKTENIQEKLTYLQALPGIGPYSARTTLLYGLREYSVAFVDVYVRKVLQFFFKLDLKLTTKNIYAYLDEHFFPYQGLLIDWISALYHVVSQSKELQIKFA